MKITNEHYSVLHMGIMRVRASGLLPELDNYVVSGLTDKRWRWDLMWKAQDAGFVPEEFINQELYKYLNDDNIDAALRRITL